MRRDHAKKRPARKLLVNDFLCVIKAAAALNVASEALVSLFARPRAVPRRAANLFLGDPVTDADDHGIASIVDNANYSQLLCEKRLVSIQPMIAERGRR